MKQLKSIRRAANIGLYGSIAVVALVIAEHYLAQYVWERAIVANEYTHKLFLATGLVLAVLDISATLFTLRKQLPTIRQFDDISKKLSRYLTIVRFVYYVTLVAVLIVGAVIVILNENTLIMLLLLLVMLLILNYPNMYKIKSDLGLLDDEMTQLFGDKYIK